MGIQEEEERACSPVLSVVTFMGPFAEYPTSGVSTKVCFLSAPFQIPSVDQIQAVPIHFLCIPLLRVLF